MLEHIISQLSEEEKAFLLSHQEELDKGIDDSCFTDEERKMLEHLLALGIVAIREGDGIQQG